LKKRHGICLPSCVVEVDRQEEAGLVEQKRIDAGNERLSRVVPTLQVPPDDVIGHRNEATIRAERAFDTRLLANPAHPLVHARRCVARSTCSAALESACVDILTTAEQRTEERDLRRSRRVRPDALRDVVHRVLNSYVNDAKNLKTNEQPIYAAVRLRDVGGISRSAGT